MQGLTQINIYNNQDRIKDKIKSKLVDSVRASRSFCSLLRVFSLYGTYIAMFFIFGSYFMNLSQTDSSSLTTFAVFAVFLYDINDCIYWLMFNSILISTSLVSLKRIL